LIIAKTRKCVRLNSEHEQASMSEDNDKMITGHHRT